MKLSMLEKLGSFFIDQYIRKFEEEKEILRHFKIEITSNILGTTTKLIQRDVPLTDEELNKLLQ